MEQEQVINRDLVLANSNILSAVAVLVVLGLMIVPVPPILLDLMLTFSIAFSVTVLLVALYLKEPLLPRSPAPSAAPSRGSGATTSSASS